LNGEQFEAELKKTIGENTTAIINPEFLMPMNNVALIDYHDGNSPVHSSMQFTTFRSKDSTVFSLTEGRVSEQFATVDDHKSCNCTKRIVYSTTYSNLKSVLVKRGDQN